MSRRAFSLYNDFLLLEPVYKSNDFRFSVRVRVIESTVEVFVIKINFFLGERTTWKRENRDRSSEEAHWYHFQESIAGTGRYYLIGYWSRYFKRFWTSSWPG